MDAFHLQNYSKFSKAAAWEPLLWFCSWPNITTGISKVIERNFLKVQINCIFNLSKEKQRWFINYLSMGHDCLYECLYSFSQSFLCHILVLVSGQVHSIPSCVNYFPVVTSLQPPCLGVDWPINKSQYGHSLSLSRLCGPMARVKVTALSHRAVGPNGLSQYGSLVQPVYRIVVRASVATWLHKAVWPRGKTQ